MRLAAARASLCLGMLFAGALLPAASQADERILDYQSEIVVHPDASMTVRETIRVRAEGSSIQRGIFRDFPTDYRDQLGNRYRVAFEVLEVTRDGLTEPYHSERLSNGVRVYVGSRNRFLEPGDYDYAITYRTDRQLGFFPDHDELYWNVTGNGWDFPIDATSAVVRLPPGVPQAEIAVEGYTGVQGSRGQDYATSLSGAQAYIQTTRGLAPREGLTLVVSWPKGFVTEPDAWDRLGYLLADNAGLVVSLIVLLGVLVYFGFVWSRYGRDPEPGVIFPHYEPPAGFSPASARYISEMSYDKETFTAAVINLAVKGHLHIGEDDDYVLSRQPDATAELAPGERVVMEQLFADGDVVVLEKDNHKLLLGAMSAHAKALKRNYHKLYFITNSTLLIPPALATVIVAAVLFATGLTTPAVLVVLALIALLHVVFYYLLKAPTGQGRRLLDKIEGFRMYLEVAEKDELRLRNPPEKTPELFEMFLPYALALGVEQAWAKKFAAVFERLAAQGHAYEPRWYAGSHGPENVGRFTKAVGSSLNSAIASAAVAPGSSSGGGGGGFSGGGGGGGGGGGW
jgi:uncharacterized membrane protein YgcG